MGKRLKEEIYHDGKLILFQRDDGKGKAMPYWYYTIKIPKQKTHLRHFEVEEAGAQDGGGAELGEVGGDDLGPGAEPLHDAPHLAQLHLAHLRALVLAVPHSVR